MVEVIDAARFSTAIDFDEGEKGFNAQDIRNLCMCDAVFRDCGRRFTRMPSELDAAKKDKKLAAAINDFASRGGKVVGFGSGCSVLPEGGVKCGPRTGVVRAIRQLFTGVSMEHIGGR